MRAALLHAVVATLAVAYLSEPARADTSVDPAGSPLWPTIQWEVFGAARTTFDSCIRATGPAFAEDAVQVSIAFDASALGKVERIVVTIDRSPIRRMLGFAPMHVHSTLSPRFKLQEVSAVCVTARTPSGVWHVGTLQVDATGGSCVLPGATHQNTIWSTTPSQVESRMFPSSNGASSRVRLRVMHPMDTGLVAGIPSFYTEQPNLLDVRHQPMLELALYRPVVESPTFSFDLDGPVGRGISVAGVDDNGNRVYVQVTR